MSDAQNYPARSLGPLAVIILTMLTINDDGVRLTTTTWACGSTERAALRQWQKDNPTLAPLVQTYELVTPKPSAVLAPAPHMGRPRLAAFRGAVGTRIKVRDFSLERIAMGL